MTITLAFDVYGTLIDTHGVTTALTKHLGDQARAFSTVWRDKQLEYSFRRGLMRQYETFAVCTSQALDRTCAAFKPDPDVYAHFLKRAGVPASEAWMVSSNPFDVLGAMAAGMRSAWVRRDPELPFDPWGMAPTLTVPGLADLAGSLASIPPT
jgi:FMN phosphatase YigB (HAD superfamily)